LVFHSNLSVRFSKTGKTKTKTKTHKQTNNKPNKQAKKQTSKHSSKQTKPKTNKQTNKQTNNIPDCLAKELKVVDQSRKQNTSFFQKSQQRRN
jgi:hypothetical protein